MMEYKGYMGCVELDDQAKARLAEALAAADEAYRRHQSSSAGHAA